MNPEELAAIKERASKATAGPWKTYKPSKLLKDWRIARDVNIEGGEWNAGYVCRLTQSHSPKMSGCGFKHPREADAVFIAHARTDVPALVAEVERLRKIADAAHVLCDSYKASIRTGWERTDARDALFAVLYAEEGGEA